MHNWMRPNPKFEFNPIYKRVEYFMGYERNKTYLLYRGL